MLSDDTPNLNLNLKLQSFQQKLKTMTMVTFDQKQFLTVIRVFTNAQFVGIIANLELPYVIVSFSFLPYDVKIAAGLRELNIKIAGFISLAHW